MVDSSAKATVAVEFFEEPLVKVVMEMVVV